MKPEKWDGSLSFVDKSDSRGHGHIYVICADDRLLPGDLERDQENLRFLRVSPSHEQMVTR